MIIFVINFTLKVKNIILVYYYVHKSFYDSRNFDG